jgi:hypothetical protein
MRQFLEILLDGDSILSEVRALRLDRRSDQAVDALTLELAGYALYSEFNFGALPASPRIQVGSAAGDPKTDGATAGSDVLTSASSSFVTQGVTTDDLLLILDSSVPGDIGAWPITNIAATHLTSSHTFGNATGVDFIVLTNQGRFFIEKPDVAEDQNSLTIPSLWGRSALARMIDPFTPKISRTWKVPTSFYEVTRELVREAGMDDLKIQFDIDDYPIPQDLLSVTGQYSLQIIMDLAGKTNGYVRSTKGGHLWIKRERFHFGALPVAAVLGDDDVEETRTRIEYPEFGNRILIRSSVPNASQPLRITIKAPNGCLRGDGRAKMVVEAIVVDNEGKPAADGTLVEWTIDNGALAHFGLVRSETAEKVVVSEPQRASGLLSLSTEYPIGQVAGVFLEEDFQKNNDFFGNGTFDGTQIELEHELPFTDSRLVVDYIANGVASSTLFANAGVPEQETEIHAAIGRIRDSATFCINNQRNVTIKMSANITEHNLCVPGQLSSQVLAEVDIDGQGGSGAMVQWFLAGPGSVTPPFSPVTNAIIEGEVGHAVNTFEVATKHMIVAVIGVWLLEAGKAGTNFFTTRQQRRGSFADNKIILGTDLPDAGAQVMIDYRANGIARAVFTATDIVGRSTITARVRDGTSANFEESIEIETVNRCAEGGQTPQEPPGGEKNCNDSVSVAVGCNAATYPNPINATVEECICRQESFGSPCPDNETDCRALCEQLYNKYGLDPLSCEALVTDEERRKMEIDLRKTIFPHEAKAHQNCIAECADNNGDPSCMNPCLANHREQTVDRCAQRCLDHGVIIDPREGSINCTGAKSITFTAKGGKPPYSWSASVGVLSVGEDGESAVLKPPANTGGAVPGTAYSFVIGYASVFAASCLDAHAWQDFNCNDEGVGSCQAEINAGGFFTCDGVLKDWCDFTKCNEDSGNGICNTGCMNGFPRQSAPCSTCNPVQFGDVCDRRTPTQISQGCQPCSVLFADGGIVTVRDSQGLAATAVVTP